MIFHFFFFPQSYHEFHADLFPETVGSEAPIYASQWMSGTDAQVEKISLDPRKWQGKTLSVNRGKLSDRKEEAKKPVPVPRKSVTDESTSSPNGKPFLAPKPSPRVGSGNSESSFDYPKPQPVALRRTESLRNHSNGSNLIPTVTADEERENTNNVIKF